MSILKNPYKVLGLSNSSNEDQVKDKYRQLVKEHHPDNGGDVNKFIKIHQAFEMIINREVIRNVALERQEAIKIASKYHIAFIAISMFTLIVLAILALEYYTFHTMSTLYAIPILISLAGLMRYMVRRTLKKVNMKYLDFDVYRDELRAREG